MTFLAIDIAFLKKEGDDDMLLRFYLKTVDIEQSDELPVFCRTSIKIMKFKT